MNEIVLTAELLALATLGYGAWEDLRVRSVPRWMVIILPLLGLVASIGGPGPWVATAAGLVGLLLMLPVWLLRDRAGERLAGTGDLLVMAAVGVVLADAGKTIDCLAWTVIIVGSVQLGARIARIRLGPFPFVTALFAAAAFINISETLGLPGLIAVI